MRYLAAFGCGINEISRITGLAQATVWNWMRGRGAPQADGRESTCWRCDSILHVPAAAYVYLLGLYLGDGHIVDTGRGKGVYRLEIFQDSSYSELIEECRRVMTVVLPNTASVRHRPGCTAIGAYSKHWPCLFPQHGPGRKHERPIVLEPWQRELVAEHPKELLRGLVHSDGCRSMNTVVSGGRTYSYPRYQFTNASDDIRRIFTDTCDLLGVHWTQMNARNVAISRREDVAFLDTFIGPKS